MNKYELIQVIKTFFNSNASAASVVAEGAVPKNQQQGFVRFDKMNTGDLENYRIFFFESWSAATIQGRKLFKGGNYCFLAVL